MLEAAVGAMKPEICGAVLTTEARKVDGSLRFSAIAAMWVTVMSAEKLWTVLEILAPGAMHSGAVTICPVEVTCSCLSFHSMKSCAQRH